MVDRWIAQYGKRLYGLCLHLCRNTVEADDLYQDTWIRVLRNQARFDPDMPFEPWLTKICVNLYRSRLRRIARSPFLTFADGEQQDAVLESVFAPEEADYSDLYAAIDRLPEKLRTTVILFYFREMDVTQTAAALGIPVGTVKSRLNKARKNLKEMLTDETDLSV